MVSLGLKEKGYSFDRNYNSFLDRKDINSTEITTHFWTMNLLHCKAPSKIHLIVSLGNYLENYNFHCKLIQI